MAAPVTSRDYAGAQQGTGDPSSVARLAQEASPEGQQPQSEAVQGAAELAGDAEKGAPVHSFDPDADPHAKAEKARQEAKAALQPVDGAKVGRTNKGTGQSLSTRYTLSAPIPGVSLCLLFVYVSSC